ncbi:MAG: hypothetical protein HRU07_05385 [Nitrosopumilus sp.]|nr:hypothetical protein [Nitrosopumilus sp.]NRA05580.1 hypothetical protein [Nitrosopumilus sp.]
MTSFQLYFFSTYTSLYPTKRIIIMSKNFVPYTLSKEKSNNADEDSE